MASGDDRSFTIKQWSEEDRPREKLIAKGREALSDAELIAILLGTGFKDKTAVDVAKSLLSEAGNDLNTLGRMNMKALSRIKGIGPAKAITVIAALELGRRRKYAEKPEAKKVSQSRDAWEYMFPYLSDLDHEQFHILLLNRANVIIKHVQVSKGGVAASVVDAKLVFKPALEELASSIILCHNHPSGNLTPSQADIDITQKLKSAGKHLDISVLDHIIFTNEDFYSFADNGKI